MSDKPILEAELEKMRSLARDLATARARIEEQDAELERRQAKVMKWRTLARDLAEALRSMIVQTKKWNESVESILGRQPKTGIELLEEPLARYDAATAPERGGEGEG